MKKNKLFSALALTTGDQDGIGPEISYKSLAKIGPQHNVQFIIFRGTTVSRKVLSSVDKTFSRIQLSSLSAALTLSFSSNRIIEIVSNENPARWVELVARASMQKQIAGMVNAPLSKTLIRQAGLKDLGHTDILTRISKTKKVTMSFWGPSFSVALATTHLPLQAVHKKISAKELAVHLENTIHYFPRRLPKKKFRIGIVGLNPHAGETGLIGKEELKIFNPLLKKLRLKFPHVELSPPLVPDAAFLKMNVSKYDIFFCSYHDQGLIPFKLIHEQSRGCQISLGLPFVRTSVDHGTAKNLFGKNQADIGSMVDALKMAIRLLSAKKS